MLLYCIEYVLISRILQGHWITGNNNLKIIKLLYVFRAVASIV